MSDAQICDLCGTAKKAGDLGAIAEIRISKTGTVVSGNVCAACVPQNWRKELFRESYVEQLLCKHPDTIEETLKTGTEVVRCNGCGKIFEVLKSS